MWRQAQSGGLDDDGDLSLIPQAQSNTAEACNGGEDEDHDPALADPRPNYPANPSHHPAQQPKQQQLLWRNGWRPGPARAGGVRGRCQSKRPADRRLTWIEPLSAEPGRCRTSLVSEPVVGSAQIVPVRRNHRLQLGSPVEPFSCRTQGTALV